jgi:hypothetical protein
MYSVRFRSKASRRSYERELGAGYAPSPSLKEAFGYSEPLRRFIQRESFEPQANEIPNTMPSWLPGDDSMTNFKVGDPYVRIDDGYARLPGAGYEAIHPELEGVNPEDYPDIHKLRILADVAPYSQEYNQGFPSCRQQKPSRTRVVEAAGLRFSSAVGLCPAQHPLWAAAGCAFRRACPPPPSARVSLRRTCCFPQPALFPGLFSRSGTRALFIRRTPLLAFGEPFVFCMTQGRGSLFPYLPLILME